MTTSIGLNRNLLTGVTIWALSRWLGVNGFSVKLSFFTSSALVMLGTLS